MKNNFDSLNGVGILVENKFIISISIYFSALSYILIIYISVLMPGTHHFNYCSFVLKSEVRKCEFFNYFSFKIVLTIQDPVHFIMNFRNKSATL